MSASTALSNGQARAGTLSLGIFPGLALKHRPRRRSGRHVFSYPLHHRQDGAVGSRAVSDPRHPLYSQTAGELFGGSYSRRGLIQTTAILARPSQAAGRSPVEDSPSHPAAKPDRHLVTLLRNGAHGPQRAHCNSRGPAASGQCAGAELHRNPI